MTTPGGGLSGSAVWVTATVEWNGQRLQAARALSRDIYDWMPNVVDEVKMELRRKLAEEIMKRMTVHYSVG